MECWCWCVSQQPAYSPPACHTIRLSILVDVQQVQYCFTQTCHLSCLRLWVDSESLQHTHRVQTSPLLQNLQCSNWMG